MAQPPVNIPALLETAARVGRAHAETIAQHERTVQNTPPPTPPPTTAPPPPPKGMTER